MKTNITNTFSISTTFTADGGSITRTTRTDGAVKVTRRDVAGRDGRCVLTSYDVVTPSLRGSIVAGVAERFVGAAGRELGITAAREATIRAAVEAARL